jgi:hypothetical protein
MPVPSRQNNVLILNGIYSAAFSFIRVLKDFSYSLMQAETAISYISFFPAGMAPDFKPLTRAIDKDKREGGFR